MLKRCRVLKFTLKLYEIMLIINIILADDLAQQMQLDKLERPFWEYPPQ